MSTTSSIFWIRYGSSAREKQNEIEWIRAKLIRAEQRGFTDMSAEEIRIEAKKLIHP